MDKNQHVWRVFLINKLNQRIKTHTRLVKIITGFIHIVLESDKKITKYFDVEDTKEYSQMYIHQSALFAYVKAQQDNKSKDNTAEKIDRPQPTIIEEFP